MAEFYYSQEEPEHHSDEIASEQQSTFLCNMPLGIDFKSVGHIMGLETAYDIYAARYIDKDEEGNSTNPELAARDVEGEIYTSYLPFDEALVISAIALRDIKDISSL